MKIPPKKPHFFKPIQPGFKNGLKIPVGFLKYLKGHNQHEHAILKSDGKKWQVKLNDQLLEEGWGKFVEENDLQLGDLLIFRHEGKMEFDVSIFDSSHCDREYAEYMQIEQQEEQTSKKFEFNDKPNPSIKSSRKAFPHAEVATQSHKPFGYSHFVCNIRPYCLSYDLLCIPSKFARANRLMNKKYDLIIRDERQRSWCLRLCYFGTGVCIKGGWDEFRDTNCLKKGDCVMFEVVSDGEKPIWQFHGKTTVERMQASLKGLTEQ